MCSWLWLSQTKFSFAPAAKTPPEKRLPPDFGIRFERTPLEAYSADCEETSKTSSWDRHLVREHPDAADVLVAAAELHPALDPVHVGLRVRPVRSVERGAPAVGIARHAGHVLHRGHDVGRARERLNPLRRQHGLLPDAHDVDQRRDAGHGHGLLDAADLQHGVDRRHERPRQHDVLADELAEAGQREGDGVGAGAAA